jgi:hypothetical protein
MAGGKVELLGMKKVKMGGKRLFDQERVEHLS